MRYMWRSQTQTITTLSFCRELPHELRYLMPGTYCAMDSYLRLQPQSAHKLRLHCCERLRVKVPLAAPVIMLERPPSRGDRVSRRVESACPPECSRQCQEHHSYPRASRLMKRAHVHGTGFHNYMTRPQDIESQESLVVHDMLRLAESRNNRSGWSYMRAIDYSVQGIWRS